MDNQHFFQQVPSIGWSSWFFRKLPWIQPCNPTLLPRSVLSQPLSPTGQVASVVNSKNAEAYSQFLLTHFTDKQAPIQLQIPPRLLQSALTSGALTGVELRSGQHLVGLVFCWKAGELLGHPTGLVTWLCVHPSWRRRGVTNCLLRALWNSAKEFRIFWFRTDGWLQSPLPPLHTNARMTRRIQTVRGGKPGSNVRRLQPSVAKQAVDQWLATNPTGLALSQASPPLLEVWQVTVSPTSRFTLFLQPTFEVQRQTQEAWCEVLHWAWDGPTTTDYTLALYTEFIWNAIPYSWVDAPVEFPHMESLWTNQGVSSWSCVGLDPGVPFTRPLLPLAIA